MPTHTTFNDEPMSLVVSDYRTEGRDVAVLELRHPHGENLPEWKPGAHIALRLGSDDIVREYSLCSSPANRSVWRIAVRRAELSRGGSDYVHARLRSDAVVEVVRIGNLFPFEPARACLPNGWGESVMLETCRGSSCFRILSGI
ncbi:ferredoxin-NADP reductase [Microbacterium sp. SORGH_AS 1204]|nr:ferredoxin-NADP reductase [Microbacterium sp. SORGH_AS_1204]